MKAVAVCVVAASIYLLRLDDVAGMMVDDAWYIVLAKAIASGDGFRLISSATTPIMPSVPPLFPLLLSPAFLFSDFPNNVVVLKLLSVVAMAGVGYAYWLDLTRHRGVAAEQATWLAAAAVMTPAFVFLATSTVMAECLFSLALITGVIAVERAVHAEPTALAGIVIAALIAAAAMLIRAAGVALIVAAIAYLIARRRWQQAGIFVAVVMVCVAPWLVYARVQAPTFGERFVHGGTIAYTYSQLIARESPGAVGQEVSARHMLARAAANVAGVVTRDVGATVIPVLYRGPHESGEEVVSVSGPGRGSMGGAVGTMIVSATISVVVLIGVARANAWLTLPVLLLGSSTAMISLVGSQTFRYVVPLTPFLLWLFWRGIAKASAARIAVLVVLGFHLVDHAGYLQARGRGMSSWVADARADDEVIGWIASNVRASDAVASTNPALVYLRTGRKGVASANPVENWQAWRAAGIRYVAALRHTEPPPRSLGGRMVYQTRGRLWVLEM